MTTTELRDHFAGLAMQGVLANSELLSKLTERLAADEVKECVVTMAYETADAMLIQRNK